MLGAAFELWRKLAKPRGWSTMVTVGGAINFMADAGSRGLLVVIGLWWAAVGGALLTFTWWFAFMDSKLTNNATINWIIVIVGNAVGLYWMFARGLGPAWKAITGPAKLTEDDLVHGRADLADEEEAARVARGGRR